MKEKRKIYLDKSNQRLKRISCKKIKTTMIGAISSIEDHFGFLLDQEGDDGLKAKEIFDKLRSDILDKGNQQIRNLSKEFNLYEISLKRYEQKFTLPTQDIGE